LENEAKAWLNKCGNYHSESEQAYYSFQFYQNFKQYGLAYQQLKDVTNSDLSKPLQIHLLNLSFFNADTSSCQRIYNLYKKVIDNTMQEAYLLNLKMLYNEPLVENLSEINEVTLAQNVKFYQDNYKLPGAFVSGLKSALLPGWGKFSMGFKRQAINSFMMNALLAGIVLEAFANQGSDFRKASAISLFSVFYIGNIWGTVGLNQKHKRDVKNQIRKNIQDYYRHSVVNYRD